MKAKQLHFSELTIEEQIEEPAQTSSNQSGPVQESNHRPDESNHRTDEIEASSDTESQAHEALEQAAGTSNRKDTGIDENVEIESIDEYELNESQKTGSNLSDLVESLNQNQPGGADEQVSFRIVLSILSNQIALFLENHKNL